MFSPDATLHTTTSSRNPRRRARTGSDDSVALRHNPKKQKRSNLAPDTFDPPLPEKANGIAKYDDDTSKSNGHAVSVDANGLAIRKKGIKKADRSIRGNKADGSIVLVR